MSRTPVTTEVAEGIRDATLAVDGVKALYGGRVGEIALYLPNARIEGLRAIERDGRQGFQVHFTFDVESGRDIPSVADDVRATVLKACDAEFVDVIAADAA